MGLVRPKIQSGNLVASAVTSDDLEIDEGTLSIDATNNRVGVNTTSPEKTLSVDGDMHFQPTVTSTSHVTTAGSLDIRATDNIRIGTDGADSIRIGRENSSACKVHIRSGSNADLVVTDGKVGIGMEDPSDALEVDGDIQLTPTATSTAHLKTTGSLDVRASGNIKIGTDGADSVRLGRVNTTAVKVHLRSGTDTDMVLFNSQLGLGTETPGTQLQLESTAPYVTLKNSTSENTAGGCESKVVFEDHSDTALGQIEVSHSGSSDDTKGKMTLSTHTGSALTAALTIDDAQAATFAGDVTVQDIKASTGGCAFGNGQAATIAVDAKTGTNATGNNLTITAGAGTGTGTPGIMTFQVPTVTGSGSGAQSQLNNMVLSQAGTSIYWGGLAALGNDEGVGEIAYFGTEDGTDTLAAGRLMYMNTSGVWKYCDADAVATGATQLLAIALGAAVTDGLLLKGFFKLNSYVEGTWNEGLPCYVSEAASEIDFTQPSGSGDFVRIVGYAIDSTNVIYFNPDGTHIEL